MSYGNRPRPPARREAGLTLIEMLVAAALGLLVAGVLLNALVGAGSVQLRSSLQLGVDETMRAALELMAMDLRESNGPRVVLSGGLPGGLSGFTTDADDLAVVQMQPRNTFQVAPPSGYPNSRSFSNSSNTPVVQPNARGQSCDDIFSGGEYVMVTGGGASTWVQLSAKNPCTSAGGGALLHPGQSLNFAYSPQLVVGRVDVTRYSVQTLGGVPTLVRQMPGSAAQVVAQNISGLRVEYSADGATFGPTPVQPRAVRLTLTGTRSAGSKSSTLTLSTTVYLRDIAANPVAGGI